MTLGEIRNFGLVPPLIYAKAALPRSLVAVSRRHSSPKWPLIERTGKNERAENPAAVARDSTILLIVERANQKRSRKRRIFFFHGSGCNELNALETPEQYKLAARNAASSVLFLFFQARRVPSAVLPDPCRRLSQWPLTARRGIAPPPCARQRDSTPSIPQSHTAMSRRSPPSVDEFVIASLRTASVPVLRLTFRFPPVRTPVSLFLPRPACPPASAARPSSH